jgi:acyl-CoA synthetase (AMP-forming)/AMP-acid ligase II
VPVDGLALGDDELIEFCQKRLAPFKGPRDFVVRSELPRSPTG